MNPDIQRITLAPTQPTRVANIAIASSGVVQLAEANDQRQFLMIENVGLSTLYIGASSNLTVGATGTGFGTVLTAGSKTLEGYAGELWGTYTGLSHATGHVVKVLEY